MLREILTRRRCLLCWYSFNQSSCLLSHSERGLLRFLSLICLVVYKRLFRMKLVFTREVASENIHFSFAKNRTFAPVYRMNIQCRQQCERYFVNLSSRATLKVVCQLGLEMPLVCSCSSCSNFRTPSQRQVDRHSQCILATMTVPRLHAESSRCRLDIWFASSSFFWSFPGHKVIVGAIWVQSLREASIVERLSRYRIFKLIDKSVCLIHWRHKYSPWRNCVLKEAGRSSEVTF